MNFSERTQVFIVAAYYRHLTEQFGERGKAAFLHGVKHYGMQWGSRMAQRAIGRERLWITALSAGTENGSPRRRR